MPWIIRRAFFMAPELPVELSIPEKNVEEGFSDIKVVSVREVSMSTTDLGFKKNVASELKNSKPKVVAEKYLPTTERIEILHIMAPKDKKFMGYELLQTLQGAGLQFGPMNIFHKYIDDNIVFSVASAVNPGVFNMEEIGAFETPGLSLFMDKTKVLNPQKSLVLMYEIARDIADDLGGELQNAKRQ